MENEEKKNANEATSKELAQAICLALSAKRRKISPRCTCAKNRRCAIIS
ncbi:MAG: hypothetical protein ACLTKZ_05395 [Lachnospiraceae bacterium]